MILAAGFDLDDTLYEHQQYIEGAYWDIALEVERRKGISGKNFFKRILSDWTKLTSQSNTIFSKALSDYNIYSLELEADLLDVYRAHEPTLTPYPGVVQGLQELKNKGVRLGLLTDGQLQVQQRKLNVLGLEKFFDVKVYTGSFGVDFYKPHPRGFQSLVAGLKVPFGKIAYLGDNPSTDFQVPKEIGMQTIRLQTGQYKNLKLNAHSVDQVFSSISQAIHWLIENKGTA